MAIQSAKSASGDEETKEVVLTTKHLEKSIMEAKPLSIQDLLVEVPKTLWSEIGGNESIKFQV